MVKVFPFEGIRYNKELLKDLSDVFTPPYDVISPTQQDEFYEAHDFNFIRVILGKEFEGDSQYNNKYVRSAAFLDGWLRHRVLVREERPVFYAYEQKFKINGKKYSRLGFFALIRFEEGGKEKILPHEATHSKAKIDRFELMRATSSNLEPIFSFYSDEKKHVNKVLKAFMKKKPLVDVIDSDKVTHRLWRVDRQPSITKIMKEMRDKTVFIADGHHRFEAALRWKNDLKQKNTKFTDDESYNHVMMYFTALEDEGLVVLPIHRVLKDVGFFDQERFLADLANYFEVEVYKATKKTATRTLNKLVKDLAKRGETNHVFGLYLGHYKYCLLTLKDTKIIEAMIPEERPIAWKTLDTNILHYIVFDRILGIGHQIEEKIEYVKGADEAVSLVDKSEKNKAAFILNPVPIKVITEIAGDLQKMPQKTTFFYPKLLSGLVMNKIDQKAKISH